MAEIPDSQAEQFDGDLERLYQQALDAMEAVDSGLNRASEALNDSEEAEAVESSDVGANRQITTAEADGRPSSSSEVVSLDQSERPHQAVGPQADEADSRVTPAQIIESALFVGGVPLTTKRLCGLLRGDFDPDFVDATIDDLNARYAGENRPYEIRFGEGGFRLELRQEFERVRNRVFGLGPKEIKLSQETLEVLALVAYKQPVSRQQIEQIGKHNAGGVLSQLLRRELIGILRPQDNPKEVNYHTTPRFLQVFGLRHLDELPLAEELNLK